MSKQNFDTSRVQWNFTLFSNHCYSSSEFDYLLSSVGEGGGYDFMTVTELGQKT